MNQLLGRSITYRIATGPQQGRKAFTYLDDNATAAANESGGAYLNSGGTEAESLTPISPFRPRRWKGAVLPASAHIRFEILDNYKRPVSATADVHEVRNVVSVDVYEDRDTTLKLMFDPEHSLEDRILAEQFL